MADVDDEEAGSEVTWLQGFAPTIERSLFEARRIFLYGEINQRVARDVTQRLVAMAAVSGDPITIFLNSQGGHVEAGDTIHDMIRFVTPQVRMIGTGWVASAGAHIFLAAERENRFCLPNTRFMLHQPRGGVYGQAMDIGIEAQEIIKMRKRLNQIIARQTGQPLEKVEKDTDRNYWMGAEAAVEYGIVGRVISNEAEIEKR
jgi:ATP-dependent Clp protease, protease subunit